MKENLITYLKFLEASKASKVSLSKDQTQSIIDHFRPLQPPTSHYYPTTFIADFTTNKYLHLEETCFNIVGYTADYFMENGLEGAIAKWHPVDFKIVNSIVFPDDLLFFKTITPEEYGDFIVTYNYRMRNPEGNDITLLQRLSFLPGNNDSPAGAIGVLFDITHYKTDHTIIHTIERVISTEEGLFHKLVFKKIHPVIEEHCKLLSQRETEILKLIAQGFSSKQIAGKINLSVHTVYNHRKNMLAKTSCRSSSELTRFATTHSII